MPLKKFKIETDKGEVEKEGHFLGDGFTCHKLDHGWVLSKNGRFLAAGAKLATLKKVFLILLEPLKKSLGRGLNCSFDVDRDKFIAILEEHKDDINKELSSLGDDTLLYWLFKCQESR